MDTPTDFLFLEESVAKKHNPKFGDREYLVIRAHPLSKTIRVVYRTYDYWDAEQKCELENLSDDYSVFTTRIYHNGKLWISDKTEPPYSISEQQFWEIHPDYKASDIDGEVEIHHCSYPYFKFYDELYAGGIITCLNNDNDNGRDITVCPNCGESLTDDNEDDDNDYGFIPAICKGCSNYHGEFYQDVQLICAIHPYGCGSDFCPAFVP